LAAGVVSHSRFYCIANNDKSLLFNYKLDLDDCMQLLIQPFFHQMQRQKQEYAHCFCHKTGKHNSGTQLETNPLQHHSERQTTKCVFWFCGI
jgi:hypothetical protein